MRIYFIQGMLCCLFLAAGCDEKVKVNSENSLGVAQTTLSSDKEVITFDPATVINNNTPESKIKLFFYYLAKNKRLTYDKAKSLIGVPIYAKKLQQEAGYRDTKGNLIKKPEYSLLWDELLKKRKLFLPERKFIISDLYYTACLKPVQPVLSSKKGYNTGVYLGTVLINRTRAKKGHKRKEQYNSLLVFVFHHGPHGLCMLLSESTLDGRPLLEVLQSDAQQLE